MRTTSRAALAALALAVGLLAEAHTALAQVNVLPGQRIRATMSNGGLVTGTVVSVSADSLTINTGAAVAGSMAFTQATFTPGASNVKVPVNQIAMVEISRGRSSGLKKGAMYGAVGGGVLGALAGITAFTGPGPSCASCFVAYTGFLAAAGALNGLWIGHFWLSGETWVVQYGGAGGGGAAWSPGLQIGMRVPAW